MSPIPTPCILSFAVYQNRLFGPKIITNYILLRRRRGLIICQTLPLSLYPGNVAVYSFTQCLHDLIQLTRQAGIMLIVIRVQTTIRV